MPSTILRASVGDLVVLEGEHTLNARGNWIACLECPGAELPPVGSPASVLATHEDGTVDTWIGTVRRSGLDVGGQNVTADIVGGKGLLLTPIPPRDHAPGATSIPAGLVLAAIVADAGEVLAPGVESALDAYQLPRWTRLGGTPSAALDLLADVLGLAWRVLATGEVWMGAETWPAAPDAGALFLEADPSDYGRAYACDGTPLLPGQVVTTLEGPLQISEAIYQITPGALRCTVRAVAPGDPVRPPDLALYSRAWAATVATQDTDGTLTVTCDDARIGTLRALPLRCGIPGAKVTLQSPANGVRVLVAFEGGDPRRAYALPASTDPGSGTAWLPATTEIDATGTIKLGEHAVQVQLGPGGNQLSVALLGATVAILFPPLVPFTAMLGPVQLVGSLIMAGLTCNGVVVGGVAPKVTADGG